MNENKEIKKRLQSAHAFLKNGEVEEAEKDMDWILTLNKLKSIKSERNNFVWGVIITLLCLIIISVLMSVNKSSVNIEAVVEASSFKIHLAKNTSINKTLPLERISFNYASINNENNILDSDKHIYSDVDIKGTIVYLEQIEFIGGTTLEIVANENKLWLYLYNGNAITKIAIRNGILILDSLFYQYEIPLSFPTETFVINSISGEDIPVNIALEGSSLIDEFTEINIKSIGFNEEEPLGSGNFISTIEKGNIRILETDELFFINKGDKINCEFETAKVKQIKVQNNHLELVLTGRAKNVKVIKDNYVKELNVSLLEYLYSNNKITILWGGIIYLWGLLWSFKKLLKL